MRYFHAVLAVSLGTAAALHPSSAAAQGGLGACCDEGACTEVTMLECEGAGGLFMEEGTNCAQTVCPPVLPVELNSFEARVEGMLVRLDWGTATETDNAGFDVEHQVGTKVWTSLAFVQGGGTTRSPQFYSYTTGELDPGTHRFRLRQTDYDGAFEYSEEVEIAVEVPGQFVLRPAYPNPFNPSTRIDFAVARSQPVKIRVYSSSGTEMMTTFDGTPEANTMQSVWIDGSSLPSGSYFIRLEGASFAATQEIVLVR
ncbi:MAG TPA: T9SS type A sorting domain-containing protein [Rhodothermia bacterium]|nr:T9SS type A sorting domain-containing protein [Rhodothermia bacterium]